MDTSPQSFNWLLSNFVRGTDGVRDAVAVSSDGLLIAMSQGLGRTAAVRLAALTAGLASLAKSPPRYYDFDGLKLIMIEMGKGFLLVSTTSDGRYVELLAVGSFDICLIGIKTDAL